MITPPGDSANYAVCARAMPQKKGIKWEDYPFARFNKRVQLLSYNDDEYEQLLHSELWTRKQTVSHGAPQGRERA